MTRHGATAVGILLVVGHAYLFAFLLDHCHRDPLRVIVTAPASAATLDVRAELPASIFDRVVVAVLVVVRILGGRSVARGFR